MKANWLGVFFILLVAIGGLLFFIAPGSVKIFTDAPQTLGRYLALSQTPKDQRPLELGDITGKTQTVPDEPKVILNDPALKEAWGIQKADALKAWRITQGSSKIVVAVIDTGCDRKHEDLVENFWMNPNEVLNGKDDDNNGFIDDLYGWNFVENNPDITDNHGHGTHVAGIIGAMANNGKGIAGIAPKVKIMCLKYFDPKKPSDHLNNTIKAIEYAVQQGAHIINYSGGGLEPSEAEKAAIEKARSKGILFVAAAGNERSNSDIHRYYPADYGLDNIISVTAINPASEVLPSSNYGVQTVDIAAPGHNILSTLPGNSYGMMTGTSQATAFVTGAAVLVMAHRPEFNYLDVKKYILQTGDPFESLVGKTRTSRRLNLFKALTMMDQQLTLTGLKAETSVTVPATPDSSAPASGFMNLESFSRELMKATQKQRSATER